MKKDKNVKNIGTPTMFMALLIALEKTLRKVEIMGILFFKRFR